MAPQNKYDFSQPSISGKPGFEIFDKNGDFFFHLNDEQGKAFLFSQAYRASKSRDAGLRSTIANADQPGRLEREKTTNGKHYFLLRAGNKQEIARSRPFDSLKEMEDKIKFLSTAGEHTPIHPISSKSPSSSSKPKLPSLPVKEIKGPAPQQNLPKHSFRIEWYPESRSGKIEHIVSGEGKKFKGLDGETIIEFLAAHLPMESSVVKLEKKPKPVSWVETKAPDENLEKIVLRTGGKELKNSISARTGDCSMELSLPPFAKEKTTSCSATVVAKSLKTFQKVPIGNLEQMLPPHGKLSVPILTSLLEPGPYRLIAKVALKGESSSLEGSKLVQIW